ncbi:DUF6265 family protein [Aquimarina litoralis]|uniref:DUF6265 family protein n=1 Tax=Aquimarina litoralis TaxID=584605 RepID=UPI001C55CFE3|nr:DUF6265 family protein [Aquimarina litoralis]MBW1294755.1 hypothetical protein [Aquimarina litoralis]
MKTTTKILLLVFMILAISCKNDTSTSASSFEWILGDWVRLNDKENHTTYESWKQHVENEYIGFSYTLKENDTIWQENVRLVKENDYWSLNITGEGENEPTKFKLTEIESGKFVSENPENEFPKKIEYLKNGKKLQAKISGGEMEITFDFKKKN